MEIKMPVEQLVTSIILLLNDLSSPYLYQVSFVEVAEKMNCLQWRSSAPKSGGGATNFFPKKLKAKKKK